MPLYEYVCQKCNATFEYLVRAGDGAPRCPHCAGDRVEKQFSVPAAPVSARGSRLGSDMPIIPGQCGRPQCAMGGCQGFDD